MTGEDERERWFAADRAGSRWDDIYRDGPPRPEEDNFRLRRDFAVGLVEGVTPVDRPVLDLGCGAGAALAELVARGRTVAGLDYSRDMLGFAKERLRARGLDTGMLVRGDASVLPFPSRAFACVICLGVISYQDDYLPILREIRRVLVPGGVALITFRNLFNPLVSDPWQAAKAIGRLVLRRRRAPDRSLGRFLNPAEVEREIERVGLHVERFEGIGLGPFKLAGRQLLSDRASIRLSRAASASLDRVGLGWTRRWSADVAMFVCRKVRPDDTR